MRKKCVIVLGILLLLGGMILGLEQKKHFTFNNYQSFFELGCKKMDLTENEKKDINTVLQSFFYSDDSISGFSIIDNTQTGLYEIYAKTRIAKELNNTELLYQLKIMCANFENIEISDFGILDILYYIYICDSLNIEFDKDDATRRLLCFYEDGFFYLTTAEDSFELKYVVTALCVDIANKYIEDRIDTIRTNATNHLKESQFDIDNGITLYNSGGAILYLCSVLNVDLSLRIEETREWFNYWREKYDCLEVNDMLTAVAYCEYLKIQRLYSVKNTNNNLTQYYESLSNEDINAISDLLMLYTILQNVEVNQEDELIKTIIEKCNSYDKIQVLDTRTTAYAIGMAYWTGFEYDKNKITNYIINEYESIEKNDDKSSAEVIEDIYYLYCIDYLVNGFNDLHNPTKFIKEKIDEYIKDLEYENNNAVNVARSVRHLCEIVSVAGFSNDDDEIYINCSQLRKIKKVLSKLATDEQLKKSVIMIEVWHTLKLLELDEVITIDVNDIVLSSLTPNGVKMYADEDIYPDSYSLFLSIKYAEEINDKDLLELLKEYNDSYKQKNGLYSLLLEGEVNIYSIFWGNYIKSSYINGTK